MIALSAPRFRALMARAKAAADEDGREICGLLVQTPHFVDLIEVRNKTKRPGGFSFYYREVREVQRAVRALGYEIIGTFHSHPFSPPTPGRSDLAGALDDSLMLILDVIASTAALWQVGDGKARQIPFGWASEAPLPTPRA